MPSDPSPHKKVCELCGATVRFRVTRGTYSKCACKKPRPTPFNFSKWKVANRENPALKKMREALEFAGKKREFEGTPRMIMNKALDALKEIAKRAKEALSRLEKKDNPHA